MSEYTDFWKELDLPVDQTQKALDFNTVASNADQLNLTEAEQYNLGWGMDATPEAWVKARAKQIQDEIDGAKSTEVLKRGLDKAPLSPEELAAKEKENATTTASEKAAQALRNNEGSGGDYSGPANNAPSIDASTHPDEAVAMQAALGTLGFRDALGALVVGPTSMAKTAIDAVKAYNTTIDGLLSDRIAVSENSLRASAAARAAERADVAAATAAQAQAQADAAAGIGPAGMGGGGYDSSGGYSQNSDRADGGWGGGSGGFGTGPGSGGTSDADSSGDSEGSGANSGTSSSDSSSDSSDNGMFNGGKVVASRLSGPDPRGPDDGYSALDVGEFVVRQKAAKYYGDDVLQAINEGRIPAEALRRLLKK